MHIRDTTRVPVARVLLLLCCDKGFHLDVQIISRAPSRFTMPHPRRLFLLLCKRFQHFLFPAFHHKKALAAHFGARPALSTACSSSHSDKLRAYLSGGVTLHRMQQKTVYASIKF